MMSCTRWLYNEKIINMTHRPWKENEKRPCRKCGEAKSRDEFSVDYRTKDGLSGFCRKCSGASAMAWAKRHREQLNAHKRAWRAANPERVFKETKMQRQLRPEQYRARTAAYNAKRAGKIKQQPCAKCGRLNSHAHHLDYSRPLDVIWLCPKHHSEEHKLLKNKRSEA